MADKNWPAWYYGPKGERDIFHTENSVPKGWLDDPAKQSGQAPKSEAKASAGTAETVAQDDGEVDSAGWPWSADLHASSRSKTKDGLWRMKVGVSRPEPKTLDL